VSAKIERRPRLGPGRPLPRVAMAYRRGGPETAAAAEQVRQASVKSDVQEASPR